MNLAHAFRADPLNDPSEWLDMNLLAILETQDAYCFESLWESVPELVVAFLMTLARHPVEIDIPALDRFYREVRNTPAEALETEFRNGGIDDDEALALALFTDNRNRVWPRPVREAADALRAAALQLAPEWSFVRNALDDAQDRERGRINCTCEACVC